MIRPKLKKVIHIPLIDLKEYFRKKYQINIDAYWDELIEHHMLFSVQLPTKYRMKK
jgi:hypothetical protein